MTAHSKSQTPLLKRIIRQRWLILMTLPGLAIVLVFSYFPMYGVLIAFKDYSFRAGIMGSPWVGLEYFTKFFTNPLAFKLLWNTFILGVYSLFWSFPAPIILALMFNEIRWKKFKRLSQTVSYFPNFISTVIVCGMIQAFATREGLFNNVRVLFGFDRASLLTLPEFFRTLYIGSGIWQGVGFGTIIYLAALTGVDKELLDAADIDGANRLQRIRYINWPAITPTVTILLIFAISGIMGTDWTKILLLYNATTHSGIMYVADVADVIGTYTYRLGILQQQYEYTTAVGLCMSVIGFLLIAAANFVSKRISETSLW